LRIERKSDSPGEFTAVTKMIPIDFAGAKLELRGFLRTENISGFAGLWMREDGDGGPVAFDNMQSRELKGTTEWTEYTMMALIARVNDTHANLWSSLDARPPVGTCQLPVRIRFIENKAVISEYTNAEAGHATGLQIGDIIDAIDGVTVADLVERWTPYYAASNQPTRLRDIAQSMTKGDCAAVTLRVSRSVASACSIPTSSQRSESASSLMSRPSQLFKVFAAAATKCSRWRSAKSSAQTYRLQRSRGWRSIEPVNANPRFELCTTRRVG
jgi:hypothetical protein